MKSERNQSRPALLLVEDDSEIRGEMKMGLGVEYTVLEAKDRADPSRYSVGDLARGARSGAAACPGCGG